MENGIKCDIAECLANKYGVCTCESHNAGKCDCNAVITEPPEEGESDA